MIEGEIMKKFDYEEFCKYVEKSRRNASSIQHSTLDYLEDVVHDFIIDEVQDDTNQEEK